MSTRGINFVFERQKKLSQAQVKDRQFFRWSLIGLGVVVGIFLIAMGIRVFFVFSVKGIKDKQENTKRAIAVQEQVERDYNVFANKLKQLSELFGKRKNKQDALLYFSQLFGDVAVVSGIDYSAADNDILTFTIQTRNIFDLDQVFTILKQQEVIDLYPTIAKSNLRRGDDGTYRLNLTISLGSKEEQVKERVKDAGDVVQDEVTADQAEAAP